MSSSFYGVDGQQLQSLDLQDVQCRDVLRMAFSLQLEVWRASCCGGWVRQPAQLLITVPAVRVAATAGRGRRAAHLGSLRIIVVHSEALVQVRLLHASVDALMALVTASHTGLCHGP